MSTVLVTGASGGIGYAVCDKYLSNGDTVVGIYLNHKDSLGELSDNYSKNFFSYNCDLSKFSCVDALFNELEKAELTPDILINNAGISVVSLLQDIDQSTWDKLWNTNVTSYLAMSKNAIPFMLKKGFGSIINISSVWGCRGASMEAAYSATKGAINSMTKALSKELAPSNISVNAIACGIIDTKMNAHLSKDEIQDITDDIPASRLGTPKDVADTVYLLSHASPYLTGQIIGLDGGWMA